MNWFDWLTPVSITSTTEFYTARIILAAIGVTLLNLLWMLVVFGSIALAVHFGWSLV